MFAHYTVSQMSSHSGSLGGHWRSVSLTRMSRPSVGVGQHGAQRVSGAAFDNRSSGGNSMMLRFHVYLLLLVLCMQAYLKCILQTLPSYIYTYKNPWNHIFTRESVAVISGDCVIVIGFGILSYSVTINISCTYCFFLSLRRRQAPAEAICFRVVRPCRCPSVRASAIHVVVLCFRDISSIC